MNHSSGFLSDFFADPRPTHDGPSLTLVPHDSTVLKAPCQPIDFESMSEDGRLGLIEFARQMYVLMKDNGGVGLAAPQIGAEKRIIVVHGLGALVNPVITGRHGGSRMGLEACLSLRGHVVRVRRYRHVDVEFDTVHGVRKAYKRLSPDLSRIVQHEIDHLDGKVIW